MLPRMEIAERVCGTQHVTNPMQENRLVERLADDVVRSGLVGGADGILFAQHRRQQDGNIDVLRVGANGAAKIEAAHIRHDDIGDDERRRLALEQRERRDAVLGFGHLEAATLEERTHQDAVDRIVVGDQYGRPAAGRQTKGRWGWRSHNQIGTHVIRAVLKNFLRWRENQPKKPCRNQRGAISGR